VKAPVVDADRFKELIERQDMKPHQTVSSFYRRARLLPTFVVPMLLFGCSTPPSYVPGTGNTLGTITDAERSYTYEYSGPDSKVSTSEGGSFVVDASGNVTEIVGPSGAQLQFTHNTDGTITIFFDLPDWGAGQVTLTPDQSGRVKISEHVNAHSNGTDKCADLVDMCESISFFLEVLFPTIREDIVAHITTQAAIQHQVPESVARIGVEFEVDAQINQVLEFCAGVQLIEVVGAPPCDHANGNTH
jgi:hypothetical protein